LREKERERVAPRTNADLSGFFQLTAEDRQKSSCWLSLEKLFSQGRGGTKGSMRNEDFPKERNTWMSK